MDLAGQHLAIIGNPSNLGNPGPPKTRLSCDCLAIQTLVLIGCINLQCNVLVTVRILAISAARACPLHKWALYMVFAGFSL